MYYPEQYIQTPHYSKGVIINPDTLVLHHINYNKDDVIKLFTNSSGVLSSGQKFNCKVSAHCLILKNGERIIFGKPNQKLWHAGESEFKGRKYVNNFSYGVEFEGDTNREPLTFEQIDSLIEHLCYILEECPITYERVTTHARIAPTRKTDISEKEFKRVQAAIKYLFV